MPRVRYGLDVGRVCFVAVHVDDDGGPDPHVRWQPRLHHPGEGTADETLLATDGGDHNVIVYDVPSSVRVGTPITIPDDESNRIALSLDGRWLPPHATKIWDLDPDHPAA